MEDLISVNIFVECQDVLIHKRKRVQSLHVKNASGVASWYHLLSVEPEQIDL